MKYYTQMRTTSGVVFDVVWGEPLKDDNSLIVYKRDKKWNILDVDSGLNLVDNFATKKEALEWFETQKHNELYLRIAAAKDTNRYRLSATAMCSHRILNAGDRCTYIDVKDSVILDLIRYSPISDTWLVKDEWHQFEVSPDRIIKVSEVQ